MSLEGRRIALTRPRGRGQAWVDTLEAAGAAVEHYPLLRIEATDQPLPERADRATGLIFISPSAADIALPVLQQKKLPHRDQTLAAVGKGTAVRLQGRFAAPLLYPENESGSEALLEIMPPVAGQIWLIVQGEGGREVLRAELQAAGAEVVRWAVYRRVFDTAQSRRLLNNLGRTDALVISSSEVMRNLHTQAAGAGVLQTLQSKLIVVFHPRMAETASSLGFSNINTAADAESVPALLTERLSRRS